MEFSKITDIYKEVSNVILRFYEKENNTVLPEIVTCKRGFDLKSGDIKNTTLAYVKTLIYYDSNSNDKVMTSLPIIFIYDDNITDYIKYAKLKKSERLEEHIYRIFLLHELVHYFQLKDKLHYSTYLKKNYKRFERESDDEFIKCLERDCVFTLKDIIKKYYNDNELMKRLWSMEMLEFKRIYLNDYTDDLKTVIGAINDEV